MEHADPNTFIPQIATALAIVLMAFAVSAHRETLNTWIRQTWIWRVIVMSRASVDDVSEIAVVHPVVRRATSGGQLMATTDNEDNEELSDNAVVQVVVPEEARDIIRFQAQVETLATLIKAGIVSNKATGIEKTFGCSRSSKPDSTYQKVLKLLDPMLNEGPKFRDLDDDGKPILTHTA